MAAAGNNKYDLIIIGGGAAAFSAAIKANMHRAKTAMIERGRLGGTCVNVGCIPSKNLLGTGEIVHASKKPSYPSVFPCDSNFDFSKANADKDNLVGYLQRERYYNVLSGLDYVEFIEASASFISDKKLKVTNGNVRSSRTLQADKFIIATGSSASTPLFDGINNVDYLTNVEALSLKERPSSMIIVGGRALGLEFAQMYSRFGTNVTLLQRSKRIIPDHEPEISDALYNYLTEEGIKIITA